MIDVWLTQSVFMALMNDRYIPPNIRQSITVLGSNKVKFKDIYSTNKIQSQLIFSI